MTSETARRTPLTTLRSLAFRGFYGLPPAVRRQLVRLGVGTYTVGAVVLARHATDSAEHTTDSERRSGEPAGTERATEQRSGLPSGSDRMLMVRQPPGKGWSLPAGLLRRGERPVQGAAREFAEETGVRLDTTALTPAAPNAVVHTHGRWIDMVFTVTLPSDIPLRADGAEIIEVAWQRVDALPPVTPATARLLAHYGLGPYAEYPEVTR